MLRDARPLGSGFWPLQQRNWVIFGEEEPCAQLRGAVWHRGRGSRAMKLPAQVSPLVSKSQPVP